MEISRLLNLFKISLSLFLDRPTSRFVVMGRLKKQVFKIGPTSNPKFLFKLRDIFLYLMKILFILDHPIKNGSKYYTDFLSFSVFYSIVYFLTTQKNLFERVLIDLAFFSNSNVS